jgi:hypothetical protein
MRWRQKFRWPAVAIRDPTSLLSLFPLAEFGSAGLSMALVTFVRRKPYRPLLTGSRNLVGRKAVAGAILLRRTVVFTQDFL